jgi:epoxyqueuosine reductase
MIAIGNSNDSALVGAAIDRLDDEAPLVRGAAIWAVARLSSQQLSRVAAAGLQKERNDAVIEEWRNALAAPPVW